MLKFGYARIEVISHGRASVRRLCKLFDAEDLCFIPACNPGCAEFGIVVTRSSRKPIVAAACGYH